MVIGLIVTLAFSSSVVPGTKRIGTLPPLTLNGSGIFSELLLRKMIGYSSGFEAATGVFEGGAVWALLLFPEKLLSAHPEKPLKAIRMTSDRMLK